MVTSKAKALFSDQTLRPPPGSVNLISNKLTNLVSLEQPNHKPKGMCGGGLLKLAVRSQWGSSLPLVQRACTPWKILGPTLVHLEFFNFHFIWNDGILDYFGGHSRRVCQFSYFPIFYADSTKNICQISIIYRKIKNLIKPFCYNL